MKFDVKLLLDIDEEENILPVSEDMYEDTIKELFQYIVYDIDGAKIKRLEVKQKK
tara:strand:- start:172 stop:336 length:165 start_codon:yes stop_codon:yes gene_type:complete